MIELMMTDNRIRNWEVFSFFMKQEKIERNKKTRHVRKRDTEEE